MFKKFFKDYLSFDDAEESILELRPYGVAGFRYDRQKLNRNYQQVKSYAGRAYEKLKNGK